VNLKVYSQLVTRSIRHTVKSSQSTSHTYKYFRKSTHHTVSSSHGQLATVKSIFHETLRTVVQLFRYISENSRKTVFSLSYVKVHVNVCGGQLMATVPADDDG